VKYRQGLEKARLFAELLDNIITAAEDDEVSEEEFQRVVATAKKSKHVPANPQRNWNEKRRSFPAKMARF
jgi:hypothetical protein